MGDKVTISGTGKKRHCQYKYSAKERADIGKYSTEVLGGASASISTIPLRQHVHIKLSPSCKLSAYKK